MEITWPDLSEGSVLDSEVLCIVMNNAYARYVRQCT